MTIHIDTGLGIMYQDEGPWRSYELVASGTTLEELIEDATISEVDQDGGELACYGLDNCGGEIERVAVKIINDALESKSNEDT